MHLSIDKERLVITNRKPCHKIEHTLEWDRDIIKQKQKTARNQHRCTEEHVDSEYCPTELDEEKDGIKFKEQISNATCNINDIEAIIFGGQSSRFWMLRKCVNSMSKKDLEQMPFFSWNCITL